MIAASPSQSLSQRLRFGCFELQPDECRLLKEGQAIHLGRHAFDLLLALGGRAGHLVTKEQLLQRVWGKVLVEENTLQAHICTLRKVLGPAAIATVTGQGYRFTLEVEPVQEAAQAELPPRHNLPRQLTSFIGRERELGEVQRWLSAARLLTLTGTGGCGKTRLALQVAGATLERWPDGVCLVELAPLGDPTLVTQAVANALALPTQPGQDLVEAVVEWLASRRLLLVLDNAEHLLEACAQLADRLLRQCADLAILVTSRERLRIDGELTYRVPSLTVPENQDGDDVLSSEAARLFIDRARLQRPDFEVTGQDVQSLATICRRLDGVALAIELAAARVRVMPLQALSKRLDDRFCVLTDGSRTALPRHRTLRSLIDWSHELLAPAEKAMLRRASVFAGGWTLDAAEQVCSGDGIERSDVLELLTSLADKNLVLIDRGGEDARFRMLESVRHYATERLVEAGEQTAARQRHIACFVDMAGGLASTRADAAIQQTLLRLDVEHDNLRAALAWCESEPALALSGLRLAGLLNWFWQVRGHFDEGHAWLVRLLAAAPAGERNEVRAAALHASGALAAFADRSEAAVSPLSEAIALWREIGDRRQLARSLGGLADVEQHIGRPACARAHFQEALVIARELGDARSIALGLLGLGEVAHILGEWAFAQVALEEGVSVSRRVGPWVEGVLRQALGRVMHARGDLQAARDTLSAAAVNSHEFGDQENASFALLLLAQVSQDMGDLGTAKAQLQMPLAQYPHISGARLEWLDALAGLMSELVDPLCAARLWGCAQRNGESNGATRYAATQRRQLRLQEAARHALQDDAAFGRAWDEGRSWSIDEAFRYVRNLVV